MTIQKRISLKAPLFLQLTTLDLFDCLLFLYFFTLHADQLNLPIGGYSIRLNNSIALVLVLGIALRFRHKIFTIDRKLFSALLFISASIFLSFLFSPFKMRCFFFMGWFFVIACAYVWLPYYLTLKWREKVLKLYFFSYLCVGLYALLQLLLSFAGIEDVFASQHISTRIVRPNAFAYEPSFYALYMTPFVMLINFLYIRGERTFYFFKTMKMRHLLLVNGLFLISTTTSALFAYFVFLGLMLFSSLRSSKVLPALIRFAALLGVVFLLLMLGFPHFTKHFFLKFFVFGFKSHGSFLERWIGIYNAWKVFVDHPIVGIGFGGYPPYLFEAWLKGDSSFIFLYHDKLIAAVPNTMKLFEPHNVLTELLASLGLVGAGAFAYLFWALYQQRKRLFEKSIFAEGLFLSTIVMLVVLQFNQGLLRTYVWVHFSIVFAYLSNWHCKNSSKIAVEEVYSSK